MPESRRLPQGRSPVLSASTHEAGGRASEGGGGSVSGRGAWGWVGEGEGGGRCTMCGCAIGWRGVGLTCVASAGSAPSASSASTAPAWPRAAASTSAVEPSSPHRAFGSALLSWTSDRMASACPRSAAHASADVPACARYRRKRGEKAGPEPGKPPPPTHRNQHQHKSYDPTQFLLPLCGPCGAPRLLAGWPGPAWARSRKPNHAKGGGACMHPGGWWWQFGRQLYMSTR